MKLEGEISIYAVQIEFTAERCILGGQEEADAATQRA